MTKSIIKEKSFEFALSTIDLYRDLVKEKEFVISRQLLKSATSIGANVEEALAAQSRRDFISKMSIASKEARETRYWLRLINESHLLNKDLSHSMREVEEINKILTSIVKSSQES
jgi:four helix bundle protein